MKKIIFTSIFISAFILLASTYQASALANPASVKCSLDGGVSVTQKDANGGEYSNCKFPDGSVCEEWAYYRGECSPKKPLTLNQLSSSCTSANDGCNNCFRSAGGQWACTLMACIGEQKSATCKNTTTEPEKPTMCTKEYMPVCGQPKMPECKDGMMCAQVMPAQKTYSNKCMMQADGASFIHQGTCDEDAIEYESSLPSFCSDTNFKKITQGSRGRQVIDLQFYLVDNGYNTGTVKVGDGIFGPKLLEAVKKFQKDKGLKADGIIGKGTRAKICNQ